jgi:hypothetical protein
VRFAVTRTVKMVCAVLAAAAMVFLGPVSVAQADSSATVSSESPKPVPIPEDACGTTTNGELCLYTPQSSTGYYTTEYCRTGGSGTITIKLGYQIDGGSYQWIGPDYFLISTGECRSVTKYISGIGTRDAIRGIMMSDGNVYVTEWWYV